MEGAKRLIFTLSPGRCGTKWLALAMSRVPGVTSVHEGLPNFVDVAQGAQQDINVGRAFWETKKLPAIWATKGAIYFESSHLFGKGFVEPLLELGVIPDVIVLMRNHREVALSFWRRRSIPGRTVQGKLSLLSPVGLEGWEGLSDYQLCYWYCMAMQLRINRYVQALLHLGATVRAIMMENLVTKEGFLWLLKEMGLPAPKTFLEGTIVNGNPEHYNKLWPEGSLNAQEIEVRNWIVSHI